MAYFAELDINDIVVAVIVVDNKDCAASGKTEEQAGLDYLKAIPGHENKRYKQTSYNATIRKNYAAKGYKYDTLKDAYIPPEPKDAERDINGQEIEGRWMLNTKTCKWEYVTK